MRDIKQAEQYEYRGKCRNQFQVILEELASIWDKTGVDLHNAISFQVWRTVKY